MSPQESVRPSVSGAGLSAVHELPACNLLSSKSLQGGTRVADVTAPKGVVSKLWHLYVLILQTDGKQELEGHSGSHCDFKRDPAGPRRGLLQE